MQSGPPSGSPPPAPPFSDPALGGPTLAGPAVGGAPAGAPGRPRRGTGDQPQYRRNSGEQPQYRRNTGEEPAVGPRRQRTDEHPGFGAPRHSTGEQPAVRPASGGGAELRRHIGRIPVIALAVAALVFLVGLPAILVSKDASADPAFASLDSLQLPGWAAQAHQDTTLGGNRWCIETCLTRERVWRSTKPAQDTDPVFRKALVDAGWRPRAAAQCPAAVTGTYTCWEHNEYVLDLWSRDAACGLSNVAPAPGQSGAPKGTDPSGAVPAPTGTDPPPTCGGSLVTTRVGEFGDPNWHK
jgi:integrin beta 3